MPIKACKKNGKPGFIWGNSSKCWTYTPGDKASMMAAKKACVRQAIAIEGPSKFKKEVSKNTLFEDPTETDDELLDLAKNWPHTLDDFKELTKIKAELTENTDCGCSS